MNGLPEGWTTATIGDLATTIRGVTYKKSDSSNLPGEGLVPLLRATNFDDGVETGGDLVYIPATLVKPEQVLMESDLLVAMSSGSIAVVGKSVPIGQRSDQRTFGAFCGVVRPKPATNARFLHHYSASPSIRQSWSDSARGTNINNLKPRTVESTAIPVPPIDEQDEIVRILDTQLARLDTVMGAVRAVRDKTDQFRRSLLHRVLSGNPQQTPTKVSEVASIRTGKIDANRAVEGGAHPFFTCARETYRIDDAPFEGKVTLVAGNGDLNVKYHEGRFNAYQRTYFLEPHDYEVLYPRFLYWLMEGHLDELRRGSIGTTIKYIKRGDLADAEFRIPTLDKQSMLSELLDQQISRFDRTLDVVDQIEVECGRFRRSLLQVAFTGELTRTWRRGNA